MRNCGRALSFDDVLLVPQHFKGKSRNDVDLSTSIGGIKLKIPLIAANMAFCELDMALEMDRLGGMAIIHRMMPIKDQTAILGQFRSKRKTGNIGASIGVGADCLSNAKALIESGASIICLDVAHADQEWVNEVVFDFVERFGNFPLIVGNYATVIGLNLLTNKLNSKNKQYNITFKAGIGGSSVCSTRIATGCGYPTFQTLLDIFSWSDYNVIADGGHKNGGDIVKSLATGAQAVMLGTLLAGTDEAAGPIIKDGKTGDKFKVYRGNASYGSKKQSGIKTDYIEGVERLIPYSGTLEKTINKLLDGVRSGFSYCGSLNLLELQGKARYTEITSGGFRESLPHGLL